MTTKKRKGNAKKYKSVSCVRCRAFVNAYGLGSHRRSVACHDRSTALARAAEIAATRARKEAREERLRAEGYARQPSVLDSSPRLVWFVNFATRKRVANETPRSKGDYWVKLEDVELSEVFYEVVKGNGMWLERADHPTLEGLYRTGGDWRIGTLLATKVKKNPAWRDALLSVFKLGTSDALLDFLEETLWGSAR